MFPPDALDRLRRFGAEVDRTAPGALSGLYAVGSLALGDYTPRSSNLDVLAVSERAWPIEQLRATGGASRHLDQARQPARIGYLTWSDLAEGPSATAACYVGGRAVAPEELFNPLTWQVMRAAGICVRGPEYPELLSGGDLRGWAAARLAGHWAAWVPAAARRPGRLWVRRATTEAALEATRLIVAVRSGRLVSKLEAGNSSIDGATTRSQRILKDAVGYRSGAHYSMYWGPFERKSDALRHVRACVEEVAS